MEGGNYFAFEYMTVAMPPSVKYYMTHLNCVSFACVTFVHFVVLAPPQLLGSILLSLCTDATKLALV